MNEPLHPITQAPFSVEAFPCQKHGNASTEYEDAWAIRGSDSPNRCRVAIADGATESSFSALWAALLVESFVRGRSNGCLLYTSPSPRDRQKSRMPSSA